MAHDSADVWANPTLFDLDERGCARTIAGVPPDYFSETGQLWGNPLYDWDKLTAQGYQWWIDRIEATLRQVDIIRIDHFRGFEAYWDFVELKRYPPGGTWWVPQPRKGGEV